MNIVDYTWIQCYCYVSISYYRVTVNHYAWLKNPVSIIIGSYSYSNTNPNSYNSTGSYRVYCKYYIYAYDYYNYKISSEYYKYTAPYYAYQAAISYIELHYYYTFV